MIRLNPAGVRASVICGLKPARRQSKRGRFAQRGPALTAGPADIRPLKSSGGLSAEITLNAEAFIRSVSLELKFRTSSSASKITAWSESRSDCCRLERCPPGILTTGIKRPGAWAFWLSDNPDGEGLFLCQSPPADFPVSFLMRPRLRKLTLTWEIGRQFTEGECLTLPQVRLERSALLPAQTRWRREWKPCGRLEQNRRTGWTADFSSPEELKEILGDLKSRGIQADWFSAGPGYTEQTGDWLQPSEPLAGRMAQLTRIIREHRMIPGLRFPPFLVSVKSAAAVPEWLVRTENGQPLIVRPCGKKKGKMHVLDVTRPEVISHINTVLNTMHNEWGFEIFTLERFGDAALPGIRHDNRIEAGRLLRQTAAALPELPQIIMSDLPLLTDTCNVRMMTAADSWQNNRKALLFASAAVLHRSAWNEQSWVNAAGPLPLSFFAPDADPAANSARDAVMLAAGMVLVGGDPRTADDAVLNGVRDFLNGFAQCRQGKLLLAANTGGGRFEPLIVRNDCGWVALFNLSDQPKEVSLNRDYLKSALGTPETLKAGDDVFFNSPSIVVALPPCGHRIFRE